MQDTCDSGFTHTQMCLVQLSGEGIVEVVKMRELLLKLFEELCPVKGWLDFAFAESTCHRLKASGFKKRIMDVILYLKCSKKWFSQLHFREFGHLQHLIVTILFVLWPDELLIPFANNNLPFCVELLRNLTFAVTELHLSPSALLCSCLMGFVEIA